VGLIDVFADFNKLLSLLSHIASNDDMFSLVHRNIHGAMWFLIYCITKKKHTK
jgi:hypothetical protein